MNNQEQQQIKFRLEHKLLCRDRAIERCDWDAANIFHAQAAYLSQKLYGIPFDPLTRNHVVTQLVEPCHDNQET